KVHSKAPTVTASMLGTVLAAGEGYTTIRDSTVASSCGTRMGGNADQDEVDGWLILCPNVAS
ncbi:hypothetical protein, partial [Micrococcus sp. NPDC055215]